MEKQTLPKMHQYRLLLENPSIQTVISAITELQIEGVPDVARLRFRQWNQPDTNFYLIASWIELDDGTLVEPQAGAEYGGGHSQQAIQSLGFLPG